MRQGTCCCGVDVLKFVEESIEDLEAVADDTDVLQCTLDDS